MKDGTHHQTGAQLVETQQIEEEPHWEHQILHQDQVGLLTEELLQLACLPPKEVQTHQEEELELVNLKETQEDTTPLLFTIK